MAFPVSAGVNTTEIDLTTVPAAVSTTEGAIAGVFRWGPIDKLVLIDREDTLVNRFGKPTNHNPETWFVAANFLSYSDGIFVSRAANTSDATGANGVLSAMANTSAITSNLVHLVKNEDDYLTKEATFESGVQYIARCPGELGNSLKISVCDAANQYSSNISLLSNASYTNSTASIITFTVGSNTANVVMVASNTTITNAEIAAVATAVQSQLVVGDILQAGNSSVGKQFVRITSLGTVGNSVVTSTARGFFTLGFESLYSLSANVTDTTIYRNWEYYNAVDSAPGQSSYVAQFGNTVANDEVHIVVSDEDGKFTGVPGTILEVYKGLSRASDAKTSDGAVNYYKTVINNNSRYIWYSKDRTNAVSNTSANVASSTNSKPLTVSFINGSDGDNETNVSVGVIATAYDKFRSAEDIDVSLLMAGKAKGGTNGEQMANYLIDNLAEVRKDLVVFVSPDKDDVVNNSGRDEYNDVGVFKQSLRSSSYYVMDSGYKYQYDKYNDVYRYIPLNGDIAGLAARTDQTNDPWFSPGGFNRGQIKNVVRLAWNPNKTDRDYLYKLNINPVVTFPGQGTVLYGDKTGLSKPSAFDRINVRRLFITLRKAISRAANFTLFEFNDEFTRAQFRSIVEPFLRDVKGRRGITDFRVVCDETNNTAQVIDANQFVGDIYVKPNRSINFVQLNFVAVRSGVEFSEVVGSFNG